MFNECLFLGAGELSALDRLLDLTGVLAIDGTADRDGGSEDLEDGTGELKSHGARAHDAGNLVHFIDGDVSVVDD